MVRDTGFKVSQFSIDLHGKADCFVNAGHRCCYEAAALLEMAMM